MESLHHLLEKFPSSRLLVLGNVILDRYWWGECERLSPEAPVPIVRKQRSSVRPGGAANTAANLAALGATVSVAGVVGADPAAHELTNALRESGINTFLVEDPERPTTTKTRVMALHQQVVRVDEEETAPLPDSLADSVTAFVATELPRCHGVVISDYAKGFLTPVLLASVIRLAKAQNCPVFVDPKGADYQRYLGCTLVKPNRLELGLLTGMPVRNHPATIAAGHALARSMHPATVLVTEGADGMTAFTAANTIEHVDSLRRQVFDVTGAGDTVLAAVAVAICSGATLREAMELASRAASIAIGLTGTSVVTREALLSEE